MGATCVSVSGLCIYCCIYSVVVYSFMLFKGVVGRCWWWLSIAYIVVLCSVVYTYNYVIYVTLVGLTPVTCYILYIYKLLTYTTVFAILIVDK